MTPFRGSVMTNSDFTHDIAGGAHGCDSDNRRRPLPARSVVRRRLRLHIRMSGPFAKSLMEAGWSPTAAVTARLAGGALVMASSPPSSSPTGSARRCSTHRTVVAYGLVPIAGAQLCYYNAVAHLSVGVALLLEYTAPILVVGWLWATTRRRPSNSDAGRRRPRGGRNHVGARRLLAAPTSISSVSAGAWPPRSARRATS